jgi:hypothetical protein
MEINIEKRSHSNELSEEDSKKVYFIEEYLEQSYKIKKQGTIYLLKNRTNKILIDETTINKMYKTRPNIISNATGQKNTYISQFLLKSLQNKWTIEKKHHNYILSKKHRGKKEYFSPNFLTCFMENSF